MSDNPGKAKVCSNPGGAAPGSRTRSSQNRQRDGRGGGGGPDDCQSHPNRRGAGFEERRTVYSTLELRVEALPGRSSKIRGASGEENLSWEKERTSRRYFPEANFASSARLQFTITSKDGRLETTFKLRDASPVRGQ